ncbi:hypothetical protein FACS1894105_13870 [Clostridia bacterium]|nr:hypothetical protein FACS1894105_13870 [Clostridia bacterium]
MGAFVFAGQMINFSIPGTFSSGHIGGGILLAAILGPFPALLTLASVLLIQCLFFADGGLLAYGCNVFNMGFLASVVAYSFLYRLIMRGGISKVKIMIASVVSVVIGLQLGAFAVVLETLFSGITELPFAAFAALMQPIHLAIGLVEGVVTGLVLIFLHSVRPEVLNDYQTGEVKKSKLTGGAVIAIFAALTVLTGGGLSLIASGDPDGLEWAIGNITESELESDGSVHEAAANVVDSVAVMPDYDSPVGGTTGAGIIGSAITVVIAGGIGLVIALYNKRKKRKPHEVTDG